jgi:hypothetical protein
MCGTEPRKAGGGASFSCASLCRAGPSRSSRAPFTGSLTGACRCATGLTGWKRAGRWESLHATGSGQPQEIAEGSLEEFITEHYWGYTTRRPGSSSEYQVEHPRWRIWHDVKAGLDADAAALYGERFASCLAAGPAFAFIAEGSAVAVRKNLAV